MGSLQPQKLIPADVAIRNGFGENINSQGFARGRVSDEEMVRLVAEAAKRQGLG